MELSIEMKRLKERLKKIGNISVALCRHKDRKVEDSMIEINSIAKEVYEELSKIERKSRHKELDPEEHVIKFL